MIPVSSSATKEKFGAADNHQASSRYHSYAELQQYDDGLITNQIDVGLLNNYHSGSSSGIIHPGYADNHWPTRCT